MHNKASVFTTGPHAPKRVTFFKKFLNKNKVIFTTGIKISGSHLATHKGVSHDQILNH